MSSLRCVEGELPPGFRFHPRDHELICDYLMKWMAGCSHQSPLLIEVDLNKCEPWDIPETACVGGKEWYFYSQRDRKYATGLRTNRATVSGYWKATGKDRSILRNGTLVGMRKTLVFYQGRAPKGKKTEWVMHEFRLEGNTGPGTKTVVKEDWVLCRVFYKNRSSEMLTSKQETSDVSLPPLMEPYITFDTTQYQASNHAQFHEQVPCFSIYNQNQTSPNLPLLNHTEIFPNSMTKIMPNNFEGLLPDLGIYNNLQSSHMQSSCDKKVIKVVLNHLMKTETGNHDLVFNHSMKGSSSFGEGSSDSYLSEVGLSSMWNQYS